MQRVLILGATSPIARELAARFAREGANLFLAARDVEEVSRVAADLKVRDGVAACVGAFEASDFDGHPAFVQRAVDELGGLDGVVLCFGSLGDEELARHDAAEDLRIINHNFVGAASILALVAERLEAQRSGFIIVLGSVAGDRGRRKNYSYGSAKGALALFAQGLRGRLACAGVHVMTVKLGYVDTRMTWGRPGVFLSLSPHDAAEKIHAAWRRKANVVYVPAFWRAIMTAVRIIPERLFKRLNV